MSDPVPRSRVGPLNLRQIEVFHAIMITGTLSEAGTLLHVTQPAISRVLASTELRLGFALFERVKGRLHPTNEARKLFKQVASIHEQVQRLNDMAVGLGNGSGTVRIVSSPSFSEWLIPTAVARFRADRPEARVQYRPLGIDALLPQILLGHADIAISTFEPKHPNVVTRAVELGQIMCAIPLGHPLAREPFIESSMLMGETLIGYDKNTPMGESLECFWQNSQHEVQPMVQVRSSQTACSFVRQGVGVALIDTYGLMKPMMKDIVVRPIYPPIKLSAHISHSRIEPPSVLARSFVTQFTQVLRKDFKEFTRSHAPGSQAATLR